MSVDPRLFGIDEDGCLAGTTLPVVDPRHFRSRELSKDELRLVLGPMVSAWCDELSTLAASFAESRAVSEADQRFLAALGIRWNG